MKYVSLVGPLVGWFLIFREGDEIEIRAALNCSKLSGLWCGVYDDPFGGGEVLGYIPMTVGELVDHDQRGTFDDVVRSCRGSACV